MEQMIVIHRHRYSSKMLMADYVLSLEREAMILLTPKKGEECKVKGKSKQVWKIKCRANGWKEKPVLPLWWNNLPALGVYRAEPMSVSWESHLGTCVLGNSDTRHLPAGSWYSSSTHPVLTSCGLFFSITEDDQEVPGLTAGCASLDQQSVEVNCFHGRLLAYKQSECSSSCT